MNPSASKPRPVYTGRVVIVGNGGSVDVMPAWFWHQPGVEYIGTNRCLALAACRDVTWSSLCMRDCYRKMFTTDNHGSDYHRQLWKPSEAYKVGDGHDRATWCDEFIYQVAGWQHERVEDRNHEASIMRNSSVVLMAANWAWICGARDLALIGVDYSLPHHAMMAEPWQSYPHGDPQQYARRVSRGIERQFSQARTAIEAAGGRIVNLSPGTKLRAIAQGKGPDDYEPIEIRTAQGMPTEG